MKKLYKIIFLFFVISLNFNKFVFAKQNYWNTLYFSAIVGLGINPWTKGGNYIGYWGFVDENLDKELFGGYQRGVGLGYRPSEFFEIFLNYLFGEYKVLLGKKGDQLYGGAISDASNGQWDSYSPPLPDDIYFTSKVGLAQFGIRVIFPITKFIEPNLGLSFQEVSCHCAFTNKDASRTYSDIINAENKLSLALTLGVNFNTFWNGKIFLKFAPYFEISDVCVTNQPVYNWIWKKWTYNRVGNHELLGSTYFRFGITIGDLFILDNIGK
jgi:hypothetical protein